MKAESLFRKMPVWGLILLMLGGCAALQKKDGKNEVPPEIQTELKEALKEAPTDELSKTYDPLSLLKKAETSYTEGNYIEAVAEYDYFLDLHPLNRWAAYAQYRLGLSYFHQIGTVDRDLEPVLQALSALQKVLDVYPDSPFAEPAKEKIRVCQNQLAQREFYVGRFYYKRAAYSAAISRFESILKAYPESRPASEAMYFLALSYHYRGEESKARASLQALLEKYPKTEHRKEALKLLSELNGQT